jgi:16S rRNA (adenine1518-N6/adenine1519-N6)-dimethyltransferase
MPELLKLQDIKQRMAAFGLRPHKQFGQNFLADHNLLRAIVVDAEVGPGDCVLEIGTGAGSLTGCLCDAAGLVISVEIDRGMFEFSREVLESCANLVQVRCDALARSGLNPGLDALLREYLASGEFGQADASDDFDVVSNLAGPAPRCKQIKVVANLPYSVATAIIFALLEARLPMERMLVMVQHEVGEKLSARPGGSAWGLPGLLLSRLAGARMLRKVHAKVFWPKPRVDSALIEIRPHAQVDMAAFARLRALAHLLFQHRRKSVANAMANALGITNAKAATWLLDCGATPGDRTEDVPPDALQKLADHAQVQPLVRKAHNASEEQIVDRAEKRARRDAWKKRVYGEEE